MTDLLKYILISITGEEKFSIKEKQEEGRVILEVTSEPSIIGLIIGRQGKTIKNIRKILAIKAAKEGVSVDISVINAQTAG